MKKPSLTPGSSSIIAFTSSMLALKMPIPLVSLPSDIGQTIDRVPSSRSEKFLRPCSQMIFSTPGKFLLGPAFRITMEYVLAWEIICLIDSSVISLIDYPTLAYDAIKIWIGFEDPKKKG